jgi:hypothetical protein
MSNMFIISLVRVLLNDPPSTAISLGDFTSAIISSIPKPSPSVSPTPISLVRVLGQGDGQHVHHLASESSPQWPPKHNNFSRRFYFSNYKQHTQTVSISQSNTPSGSSATPSKPPPSGCNPIIGFYDYQLTHQLNENTSLLKRSASNLAESNLVVQYSRANSICHKRW